MLRGARALQQGASRPVNECRARSSPKTQRALVSRATCLSMRAQVAPKAHAALPSALRVVVQCRRAQCLLTMASIIHEPSQLQAAISRRRAPPHPTPSAATSGLDPGPRGPPLGPPPPPCLRPPPRFLARPHGLKNSTARACRPAPVYFFLLTAEEAALSAPPPTAPAPAPSPPPTLPPIAPTVPDDSSDASLAFTPMIQRPGFA